jgi:isoquinoline 1-oxidoreductase
MTGSGMDRRSFLKVVGGGVVVFLTLDPTELLAQGRRPPYPSDFNAYLRVGEDGRVSVFTGKIEMGQGVMTSQAQMVAEDLGVSLDVIDMVMGDTDLCPWDMGTFGSLTTRMFGPFLRAAAAEAREVLIDLAAEHLEVPESELVVANGVVSVKGDPSRKVTYGELAKGKTIAKTLDEKAVLRTVAEFNVMGQSAPRFDGVDKVTGAAAYAGDIRRPGMLYARILRPPARGATLARADTSKAAKIDGAMVVDQDGMVAVLHADPEEAERALNAVEATWNEAEPGADHDGIFEELLAKAPEFTVAEEKGDVTSAAIAAGRTIRQTYHKGYVAHAPMEPHTATAEMKDGKLTVWASTQTPFPARDGLAGTFGLDKKNVRVITPYVGGGFGGKATGPQIEEAARLATITGKPVQVAWTRAEEFFFDTFDPASIVKITSAMDGDGRITAWDYDVYFAGSRGAELFYDVPNVRMRVAGSWMGAGSDRHRFNVGPWRAPGANMNIWAREAHLDLMAAEAGIDPLEFRLRNISDERMLKVLRAAADAFGWETAPGPSGRGRGVACGVDAGTYAALMAEVRVDSDRGHVRVERIVAAQDMGIVVNPEGAKMQMEGCVTMGLGYVLTEELRFEGGKMLDDNFDTYELPRFSRLPRIETVIVKNDDLAPQGGGEPAIVPMGGVIANAVFDATGARIDRLPMTPDRLLDALVAAEARDQEAG